jgi:hypothetical protein
VVQLAEKTKARVMKEPDELDKLNAVAIAEEASLIGIRWLWRLLIVFFAASVLFRHHTVSWFVAPLFVWAIGDQSIVLVRTVRAIRLAKSPACESEHKQIGRWISQLTAAPASPGIIQLSAGDFWTGRVIVRLLAENQWIVVATFYKENLARKPRLTIFDANATPMVYSPEQRCLRIGKRKFRKVEFTPESVAPAQQLAQRVATA